METLAFLLTGFAVAATPTNLLLAAIGAVVGTMAIMLGVLTLYNLTPGPMLFTSQPELVWGLIASLFIGNIMLLVMNIPLVGLFARMLSVPAWVLVPFIVVVSAVGVYSGKSASFDLLLMTAIGIIAYWLRRMAVPMAPLILGFVLGGILETNLRRALSLSAGKPQILWSSTISIVLWVGAAVIHLEDQILPKKCGHQSDKRLAVPAEMAAILAAEAHARRDLVIIARTDAAVNEGWSLAGMSTKPCASAPSPRSCGQARLFRHAARDRSACRPFDL